MQVDCTAVRAGVANAASRTVPEEVPVALVYDATTHAVLMATPADLADLGRGFSLTEGIVDDLAQIEALEVVAQSNGIEVRMWLRADAGRVHLERRRSVVGRTGCGLCGVESLAQALPPLVPVRSSARWSLADFTDAVAGLRGNQPLGAATRAVHAAGLWHGGALVMLREDVGRHNALDKLAGAVDASMLDGAIVVLTSRVSVEMVQKTARMGVAAIAAISAPTALAIRVAEAAGITLAAVVRDDGFEVFCGADRLVAAAP
ncbi:formate dehydrogenase accessory sulfurtransferase FdhD [Glacieibacterium sp.]|uniref:formate dehydrogenase accessory sulfurtransferase FdhD n=1 Tax=Glacieibacterium sp. TaxID=2860237 RepID=UPI003AFF871B